MTKSKRRAAMIELKAEQGSQEWLDGRLGVVTASEVINVIKAGRKKGSFGAGRETYRKKLVAEIATGQSPFVTNEAMRWGSDHEDEARSEYERITNNEVYEKGLVYKDDSKRTGASPDGCVGDDGLIEIKCPFNSVVHLETVLEQKIKPEYMAQMQFQMWVLGRKWVDFVSYDPRQGKPENTITIIRVEPDEDMFALFDEQIPLFIAEVDADLEKLGIKFEK